MENCKLVVQTIKKSCKLLNIKMIRTKYLKWKEHYFGFSKIRRKTNKKRRPLNRALLHLLNKLIALKKSYVNQIKQNLQ